MNLYRGFAILCIVLVHSLTRFLDNSLWYYNFLDQLLGESTCIFCFISGFLYEYIGYEKCKYTEFIKKKFRRLIVPYLFWSVPFLLWESLFKYGCLDYKWIAWALVCGLTSFNGALWYIQFIFVVFCFAPLLQKNLRIPYLGETITVFALFLALITGRGIPERFFYGIETIPHLLGFFLFGMLSAKYLSFLKKRHQLHGLMLMIGIALCFMSCLVVKTTPETTFLALEHLTSRITLNWLTLNKLFFSIGFLLLFYKISINKPHIKVLDELAKYSFPIYFSHLYLYLPWILTGSESHGGLLHFIAWSAYMIAGSYFLCYGLGKVKYVNKVIGL